MTHSTGAPDQLVLAVEALVAGGVPSGVGAEVDLSGRLQPSPQRLAGASVARLGGADEVVEGNVHRHREIAKIARHPVDESLRFDAGGQRRLLDLLAVLVGAGEEEHLPAVQPM